MVFFFQRIGMQLKLILNIIDHALFYIMWRKKVLNKDVQAVIRKAIKHSNVVSVIFVVLIVICLLLR